MKKTHNVSILGFGVVGSGVANLIKNNEQELLSFLGKRVVINHILDLRDFPESPFAELITHDFNDILADGSTDTVIEVMGGSHPAYEFTVAALRAGMNVITSNKEVVANFGDEFLRIAREYGVSYRFEAAVGGGIPVIAPLLSSLRQNKIREVRGILNGTTNYILTKMFTYGESFESALSDAQERGYAERNPDADILGTDASRKIAILTALATDKLVGVGEIPTEGITKIRAEDVSAAEAIGHKIKLLGRCIIENPEAPVVCVAPFLIPEDSPLAGVNDVYNAVEVVASPLENVMFYGRGAGAGPTASAVVSDLIPIITHDGIPAKTPLFKKSEYSPKRAFGSFVSKNYVVLPAGSEKQVEEVFGEVTLLLGGECAFITEQISEDELQDKLNKIGKPLISRIRFL